MTPPTFPPVIQKMIDSKVRQFLIVLVVAIGIAVSGLPHWLITQYCGVNVTIQMNIQTTEYCELTPPQVFFFFMIFLLTATLVVFLICDVVRKLQAQPR